MALKTKLRLAQLDFDSLVDNQADALTFKENTTKYLGFQTSNADEMVVVHQRLKMSASRIDFSAKNEGRIMVKDDRASAFAILQGADTIFSVQTSNADESIVAKKKLVLSGNILQLSADNAESIVSDGTDISFNVGANGDINVPADIGLTFGDDGEKIEGDGTDLTISGNKINLSPTADVILPDNKGILFGDVASGGEKIEGDGSKLTIASSDAIDLSPGTDVVLPNDKGIVFGGASEKIEGDGTDLTIAGGIINLAPATDVVLGNNLGIQFGDAGEKIEGDGTDLTIIGGDINLTAETDINVPSAVGLTFGNDGEKIEGDGSKLTVAAANLDLTMEAGGDVTLAANTGLIFGDATEKIEGDADDLTLASSRDINLTATSDVNLPAQVGLTFGADTQKIEVDGSNNLSVTAAGNIVIGSAGFVGDVSIGQLQSTVKVLGDLQVEGAVATVDTTNLVVEDPLIVLGSASGTLAAAGDRGIVFGMAGAYEGSPAFFWDHSSISTGLVQGVMHLATAQASGSETSLTAVNHLALAISDLDLSNGVSDIKMKDNEKLAVEFKEANNLYMHFQTSNADEGIGFNKKLHLSGTIVNSDGIDLDHQLRDNRAAGFKFSAGGADIMSIQSSNADEAVVVHGALRLSGSAITADVADQSVILRPNRQNAWRFMNGANPVFNLQTADADPVVMVGAKMTMSGAMMDTAPVSNFEIVVKDNEASALEIKSADGTTLVDFKTTNSQEASVFSKDVMVVDNVNIVAGAGRDLLMYHDGTDTWLKNSTGDMYVSGAGGALLFGDGGLPASWSSKGLKLGAGNAASWTEYETAWGSEQNLLDALTYLRKRSTFKATGSIAAAKAAEVALSLADHWAKSQATDVSTRDYDPERIDVFLNGQLLISGSAAAMSSSAVDYTFDGPRDGLLGQEITFAFPVTTNDVMVIKMN